MRGYKCLWIFFVGVMLYTHSEGQSVTFDYLTSKNGLPQNTIRGIAKDKYGFMWFGTWNGLCRYDGYNFKVYTHVPGDSSSLSSNRVHYLFKDPNGILWVSVFNQIVCRYNYATDNFTRFHLTDLPQALRDSVNRLRNLNVFDENKNLLNSRIGTFHLSLTKEHIVFDLPLTQTGGLNDVNVNSVYKDETGILWVGTGTGGVNKADLNASRFYHIPLHLNGSTPVAVRSILADKQRVWLGTEDKGLMYWDSATGKVHNAVSALSGQNIKALLKDYQGNIWIGKRSGLDRLDPATGTLKSFFNSAQHPDYSRFYAMAEDPVTHQIWFCYYNGILRFDPQTGLFEKQQVKFYQRSGAGCIFFDHQRNLWIGTEYSGLIQLKRKDNDKWADIIRYPPSGSTIPSWCERVYAIGEDATGAIWVGGANGLARLNPKTGVVKAYNKQSGLAHQYVTRIALLPNKEMWFAHKNGLAKMNIKNGQIHNYAVQKPGENYEFVDGAGFWDLNAKSMYWGSTEGFVYFKPSEIVNNAFLPKTTFTALQVLNKAVNTGDTINGRVILPVPLHMISAIELTDAEKSFSLEFSALHYSNPARNQYAYMLEGEDRDWIYTGADRRVASYANLSPGNYLMKVKASNGDGVWNNMATTLKIIILPPWWRTWWAYTIYFLVLGLIVYAIYAAIRTRQQYHRRIVTERLKAEKAEEVERLKTKFFTNISHEFRTPLTLIVDPLRILLSRQNVTEKEHSYYGIMYNNAQRLLILVNQLLDFRKLESGQLKLKPRQSDIVLFIKNTAAAFDLKASQKRIDFTITAEPPVMVIGFDADVVEKILYNLLSNAFKFTAFDGAVRITMKPLNGTEDGVVVEVADTGTGMSADDLDQVFEPFFQGEGSWRYAGSGVGLSLTKELVALHHGAISATSEPGVRTAFTFSIRSVKDSGEPDSLSSLPGEPEEKDWTMTFAAEESEMTEKPVVLIVEDNEDIKKYIAHHLDEDYAIMKAGNGAEGLEKATASLPDLVISDVMMPLMNGVDLCRNLKQDEKTCHIPVILLTARQSEQYELEGYETGADAYVVKPFNMTLLHARVKNLIENRARLREKFTQSPDSYQSPEGLNELDKIFLNKITELVTEHMSQTEVNVEWLSTQLLLSRTQLYRKVKAITNLSVHEFVTGVRLSKAAALLKEGKHTVTEVAFMIGYSDASSFSRMFQRQYQVTPKKYSQQFR